jgi:hypothetical protein
MVCLWQRSYYIRCNPDGLWLLKSVNPGIITHLFFTRPDAGFRLFLFIIALIDHNPQAGTYGYGGQMLYAYLNDQLYHSRFNIHS